MTAASGTQVRSDGATLPARAEWPNSVSNKGPVWVNLGLMTIESTEHLDTLKSDHEAVAEVIRAETLAFQRRDFDAWSDCFVTNEHTHDVLVSSVAGLSVLEGWPAVAAHMQRVFRDGLTSELVEFGQENMRINLSCDVAWAVFDSWSKTGDGANLKSFDVRILQRVSGRWKIVFNAFIQREIDGASGNVLGLDGMGNVTWASPAAIEALRSHPVLTIIAGRLRARRADWDKSLQSALAEAAGHHGFFETHKAAHEFGGPARYPVILGQTEDGGVAIVHISIRDCVTYVRISGDEDLERRLQFAKRVFGLSEGQVRVARGIALGQGLKGLAESLDIRVTTARTHLSRIYEKTGVRTQTALVRLLLSVG